MISFILSCIFNHDELIKAKKRLHSLFPNRNCRFQAPGRWQKHQFQLRPEKCGCWRGEMETRLHGSVFSQPGGNAVTRPCLH